MRLQALSGDKTGARAEAFKYFYDNHAKGNDLILCKWFTLQSTSDVPDILSQVQNSPSLKQTCLSLKPPRPDVFVFVALYQIFEPPILTEHHNLQTRSFSQRLQNFHPRPLIYRVGSQTHSRYCCLLNHLPGQRPQQDHPKCTSNPKFLPWIPSQVDGLLQHPDFSLTNPNKCRSVISAFAANMKYFHAKDGSGYKWLADRILQVHFLSHPKHNFFFSFSMEHQA